MSGTEGETDAGWRRSGSRDGIEMTPVDAPSSSPGLPGQQKDPPTTNRDEIANERTKMVEEKTKTSVLKMVLGTVLISFLILALVLLVNGMVVGFGLYQLYGSASNGLTVESMDVSGLEDLDALINMVAAFPTKGLARLPSFEIRKDSTLRLELPGFHSQHLRERQPHLLEIELPEIRYGRTGEGSGRLTVDRLRVKFNEEMPLSDLALWYMSLKKDGYAVLTGNVRLHTWSFLVPIAYNYSVNMRIPMNKDKKKSSTEQMASLEGLQVFEDEHKSRLRCMLALTLSETVLPKWLEMSLPELGFSLRHHLDDKFPEDMLQVF